MNASDLFKAGKLQAAIDAQVQEVKGKPADQAKRLFLYELLAFAGDLDRARKQIDVIKYDEIELESALLSYRKLLDSETVRRRLFRDGVQPQFLTEPPASVKLRLEALNRLRENRPSEATDLLRQADAADKPLAGKLNDKPFDSLRDCDDLFGPVLEVMAHGNYYWVPLEQVDSISMKGPKSPRDLLWRPARLEMKDAAGDIFIPATYPGSHEHADDEIKLGRSTDWLSSEGSPVRGVGARLFLIGEDAAGLLEWRELTLSERT